MQSQEYASKALNEFTLVICKLVHFRMKSTIGHPFSRAKNFTDFSDFLDLHKIYFTYYIINDKSIVTWIRIMCSQTNLRASHLLRCPNALISD